MRREMDRYRGWFPPFDSVYIGGGTPSVLSADLLSDLLRHLRVALPWQTAAEVTIEANPETAELDKLALLRELGVTRLSLGLQSLNNVDLCYLGRQHGIDAGFRAIAAARNVGFDQLSIDLIYGWEGQLLASWEDTLKQAVALRPEHISCYQLTIEPRTVFGQRLARGEIAMISDEEQRLFFIRTSEILTARGYLHYEVSNFAVDAGHICRHNMKYWQRTPYLGLGPAAHSFQTGRRWWNFRNLTKYIEYLNRDSLPIEDEELLSSDQQRLEQIFLGFRTHDGVSVVLLQQHPCWEQKLAQLEQERLIRLEGGRAIATLTGWAVADQLALQFI